MGNGSSNLRSRIKRFDLKKQDLTHIHGDPELASKERQTGDLANVSDADPPLAAGGPDSTQWDAQQLIPALELLSPNERARKVKEPTVCNGEYTAECLIKGSRPLAHELWRIMQALDQIQQGWIVKPRHGDVPYRLVAIQHFLEGLHVPAMTLGKP